MFTRTGTLRGWPTGRGVRTRRMVNPDIKTNPRNWRAVREWKFGKGRRTKSIAGRFALTDWIHEGVHFALMSVYENIPKPGAPYDRRPTTASDMSKTL